MTAQAFRSALKRLGLTQVGFARDIGVNPRTVRSWISGRFPVPKVASELLTALDRLRTMDT